MITGLKIILDINKNEYERLVRLIKNKYKIIPYVWKAKFYDWYYEDKIVRMSKYRLEPNKYFIMDYDYNKTPITPLEYKKLIRNRKGLLFYKESTMHLFKYKRDILSLEEFKVKYCKGKQFVIYILDIRSSKGSGYLDTIKEFNKYLDKDTVIKETSRDNYKNLVLHICKQYQ